MGHDDRLSDVKVVKVASLLQKYSITKVGTARHASKRRRRRPRGPPYGSLPVRQCSGPDKLPPDRYGLYKPLLADAPRATDLAPARWCVLLATGRDSWYCISLIAALHTLRRRGLGFRATTRQHVARQHGLVCVSPLGAATAMPALALDAAPGQDLPEP